VAESVELATAYVQIIPSLKGVEDAIARALGGSSGSPVSKAAASLGERVVQGITGALKSSPAMAKGIIDAVTSASQKAASAVSSTVQAVSGIVRPVGSALADLGRIAGTTAGDIARSMKNALVTLTPQFVKDGAARIVSSFQTMTTAVGVTAMNASDRIKSSLGTAYTWIGSKAIDAGAVVKSGFETAYTWVGSKAIDASNVAARAFQAVGERVPAPIKSAASVVGRTFVDMGRTIGTAGGQAASVLGGMVQTVTPRLVSLGSAVASKVGGALSGVGGLMGSALSKGAATAIDVAASVGSRIGGALSDTVKAGVGLAGVAVAGLGATIASNLGGAVQRADLLNNFPKVMGNIGFSSEEAAGQIKRIAAALDGLPTSTQALAQTAQGLAPITGDLTSATDVALALNNALLAGGASSNLAENAMEQYRQMLSAGAVDMAAWRSLTSAMPGQMDMVAKSILGAGASTNDLYDAMKKGNVSFNDFNAALISLNGEGLNGMASFAEQAKTATGGIGTAFTNAGNRVKAAMEKVITAIGVDEIAAKINSLTSGITGLGQKIADSVTAIKGDGGEGLESSFGPLTGLLPVIGGLAGALGGLATQLPVIGGLFGGITGPVGIVIGLFTSMWQQSDTLHEAVNSAFGSLKTVFLALEPVIAQVSSAFATIAGTLGDQLAVALSTLMPGLVTIANTVFPVLAQTIQGLMPSVQQVVEILGGALTAAIAAIMPALVRIVDAVLPVLSDILISLAPVVTSIVEVVAGVVVQAIQILAPILAQLAEQLMPLILQAVQSLIPPIQQVIAAVVPIIQQILPVLGQVLGTIIGVLTNIFSAVLPTLTAVLGTVISVLGVVINVVAAVAVPAFNLFSSIVKVAIEAVGAVFTWLWESVVNPVWSWISDKIEGVKSFITGTVQPAIATAMDKVGSAFSTAKDVITTAWDAIKGAAAKPVNFLINTVYTNGIKWLFDKVAETVGLGTRLPAISPIEGYASGGVLPGYTPGRDVYHFVSRDGGGRLALSGGEAIMVPEWTRAVGGPRAVAAMNAAARRTHGRGLSGRGDVGRGWAFAEGGIWDRITSGLSSAWDAVKNFAATAADIISDPVGAVTHLIREPVDELLGGIGVTGTWADILKSVPGVLMDAFGNFFTDETKGMTGSDAVDYSRTLLGTPYVWGGSSIPPGLDCSGLIYYSLNKTGHPAPRLTAAGYQAVAAPVAWDAKVPGDILLWGNPAHHIAWYSGGGMMIEEPHEGASAREVPIWGSPTVGRLTYDDGGWLQPGTTVVDNKSNKPEPVFSAGQWGGINRLVELLESGRGRELVVRDVDDELVGRMRVEADGRILEAQALGL